MISHHYITFTTLDGSDCGGSEAGGEQAIRRSEALLRIAGNAARLGGWTIGVPDGTIEWSPQLPDGSFARATALRLEKLPDDGGYATRLPAGTYATRLSVGNVTGDSAPDLAVATKTNQVFVYQNHE